MYFHALFFLKKEMEERKKEEMKNERMKKPNTFYDLDADQVVRKMLEADVQAKAAMGSKGKMEIIEASEEELRASFKLFSEIEDLKKALDPSKLTGLQNLFFLLLFAFLCNLSPFFRSPNPVKHAAAP